MKLEIGKRYVTRDGRITSPLVRPNTSSSYQFRAAIGSDGDWSWNINGRWISDRETHKLDLVAEHVETETVAIKSGTIIRPADQHYDYTMSGKCAGWSSATLSNIRPIEHVVEPVIVEPTIPPPPDGYLLYGCGPIKELSLHDSREPVAYYNTNTYKSWRTSAEWDTISGTCPTRIYAIKSGSALAVKCKLEPLKLEAGRRYVLTDGRVTGPLVVEELYARPVFCAAVGDDFTKLHRWQPNGVKWNDFCVTTADISHPLA